jgi:hypothetical protein
MGSEDKCIVVEVKRFAKHRKVGIGLVDRLAGAALRFKAGTAHLVATTEFTAPASEARSQVPAEILGLELIDAHELLKWLKCYSDPDLTVRDAAAILRASSARGTDDGVTAL